MISNPYNNGSNTVTELFPDVPEGTQFYTFDAPNQRWRVNQLQFGAWISPVQTFDPGLGAFIRNPTNAFSITFTGTTPTNVSIPIYQGFNLISSLPPPVNGDQMLVWNSQVQDYDPFTYSFGVWSPPPPPLNQGEARLYVRGQSSASNSVYFNNYVPATGLNAYIASTEGCLRTNLVAQLYGQPANDPFAVLSAIGAPRPVLRLYPNKGYVDATADALRWLPQGGVWTFEVWVSNETSPWSARSSRFQVNVSSSSKFPPTNLTGWEPFGGGPIAPFHIFRNPPLGNPLFEGQIFELIMPPWSYDGFTFQWMRLVNSNSLVDIPGATSYRLVFHPLKLADSGTYWLRGNLGGMDASGSRNPQVISVLPHPSFSIAATLSSSNQLRVSGSAVPYVSYEIESSTNLLQWTHLTTLSNAPASWEFRDTNILTEVQRFYRARVLY